MSNFVRTLELEFDEQTVRRVIWDWVNPNGEAAPAGTITFDSITITFIDQASGDVINNREAQSLLNENGGSWDDANASFTWTLDVADTTITNPDVPPGRNQVNTATITYVGTQNGSPFQENDHLIISIRNRRLVPQG